MQTIFTCLLIFIAPGLIFAQQTLLTGVVMDGPDPIPGANISLAGTFEGTSTAANGQFAFTTSMEGPVELVVSFIGFREFRQTLHLDGDSLWITVELKEAVNELNAVTVTAGAFEASDKKKSVTFKPLDIATTAGATNDIAGALNTLPGTQANPEAGRLFVRGGAASETQAFIDGLAAPFFFNNSAPDLPARGRFSPFLFKGTRFSSGGYSAEYGNALSSALVLETRDLAPETQSGVSLMTLGLGASHTQRWDNTSFSIKGDYHNLGPALGILPNTREWKQAPEGINSQLTFRHKTSETGMLKFLGSWQQSGLELMQPLAEDVLRTDALRLEDQQVYSNLGYSEVLGDKWDVQTGLTYSRNQLDIRQNFELGQTRRQWAGKVRMRYYHSDQLSIRFGTEAWSRQWEEGYMPQDKITLHSELEDTYLAAFAETDILFSNALAARVGLRWSKHESMQTADLAPRLSIAYKTGDHSQLSLAAGRFFQRPEDELFRYQPQGLRSEKSTHLIAGYQYSTRARTFRAEVYRKTYDRLVSWQPGAPWAATNSGEGFAQGVDLFYRDRESIRYGDFWVSYSYLDTRRTFRAFPEEAVPGFASRHNLSVVYKHWIPALQVQVGATYRFASPRAFDDPNTPEFQDRKTIPYHDLSLNISYLTELFGQFTVVHFSVNNLPGFDQSFGRRYSTETNGEGFFDSIELLPDARRFVFVGLFLSFGSESGIVNP